ncbi:DUF551 domain-containing protein [Klebsiella pneumoniae]|nr:DUF551 domain-containing protein [Klebsiella pneumoniae]MCS6069689.1 DUF551 domain-containing protein [Klebsiella pneumoniae subsp. pneumoniae]MDW1569777.1 DUF551 domain-containing protein [Klebsiella pneumoniae]PCQ76006.1 hypothetical protein CQA59_27495 [Klebsiella pneumoniae]HBT0501450.1 DUF551 domain-containing protein [Klebsiella pneumoniae]
MTSKFSIDNRELLQRISSGEAVVGIDFGNLIVRELAAFRLAAMDSDPVAIIDQANLDYLRSGADADVWPPEREEMGDVLLYRHAQPAPVVPDDVLAALQKVARIRLDLNDFDGDRRGIADCLGDAEEALIEVVNRRAAMLAAAPQSPGSEPATVPGKWIPVSEQMPPSRHEVLVGRWWGEKPRWCCKWATYIPGHPDAQSSGWLIPGASWTPTHWMPLPAAPQEVK